MVYRFTNIIRLIHFIRHSVPTSITTEVTRTPRATLYMAFREHTSCYDQKHINDTHILCGIVRPGLYSLFPPPWGGHQNDLVCVPQSKTISPKPDSCHEILDSPLM